MKRLILTFLIFSSLQANAISFKEAALSLKSHHRVEILLEDSRSLEAQARSKGSWGNPKIKVAAKNLPQEKVRFDQTAMSGLEFGISQKIALTNRYGALSSATLAESRRSSLLAKDLEEQLIVGLWSQVIRDRQIDEEIKILNENLKWIEKNIRVTKKLYSTGKTTQQSLLDIQIRKSELETLILQKKSEREQNREELEYLIGERELNFQTIPWKFISQSHEGGEDLQVEALRERLIGKTYRLEAMKKGFIPDVTISLSYTKRQFEDSNGDFVGASLVFPIPTSSKNYAEHAQAKYEKKKAQRTVENYLAQKKKILSKLEIEVEKLRQEISILDSRIIRFAKNSREITAKSYALGNASYQELLQRELKLQSVLMNKIMLSARRDLKLVELKYQRGEVLYE